MDFLLFVVAFLAVLACGVYCVIKYIRTKKKIFLVAGLILTLIVIALLLLYFLSEIPSPFITYGPPPVRPTVHPTMPPTVTPSSPAPTLPNMVYGPAPQ
jgi:hypothetical protein